MQISDKETDWDIIQTIQQLRSQHPDLVVVIYGPTATGKSALSLRLANHFSSEIISADSRQVYRYMDIWTDKVTQNIRDRIPHHLIDTINPDESYSAYQRQQDCKKTVADLIDHSILPIIVWWTGLYIDTIYKNFSLPPEIPADRSRRHELELLEQQQPWYCRSLLNIVDPDTASEFHPSNLRYIIRAIEIYEKTGLQKSVLAQEHPVDHPLLMLSLTRNIEDAQILIHKRVEEMIERGLIQEVQWLLDHWYHADLQSMNGIGYRQTIQMINDEWWMINWIYSSQFTIHNLIDSITLASVQYAKRQRTRFRRYQKDARDNPKQSVYYLEINLDTLK